MEKYRLLRAYSLVRDFLFSSVNKEFLIFLFFLALSGGFWLLMALNETYEKEITIPVKLVNVPDNVIITGEINETVTVTVRDKGYTLGAYLYSDKIRPITVNFSTYAKKDGHGVVPSADLQRQIYQQLYSSSRITSLKPDKLEFYFNYGMHKRVPVKLEGNYSTGNSYYLIRTRIAPDSVTIFATKNILDSIKYISTVPFNIKNITDTVARNINLQKIKGVKCIPSKVKIFFYPDILTEKVVDVNIVAENMPEGKILRTFPSHAKVKFTVGASIFRSIHPDNFSVVVDYNELSEHPSDKCQLHILRTPNGITNARLVIDKVDYLIEQQ
jgi:hypothetical protein